VPTSLNTECRDGACGRYGTALRPSFADQTSLHILSKWRSALFPRAEAVRIPQVSLKAMREPTVGPKIIDQTVQRRMRSVLKKICSGQFAREFIREMKTGRKHYAQLLREAEKHPIKKVGARLRRVMAWRAKI
jgi:Acetohydroxy acid isomeroreductase, catalytic domain